MKLLGMEFAPLNIPLHRRLETLAAASWFLIVAFGGFIAILLSIYLLFTRFWWLMLLYYLFIYLDRETSERGGRPRLWVQKLGWFRHLQNYFPSKFDSAPEFTLDPKRNYLFACYPHGVIPMGPFCALACHGSGFNRRFPEFEVYSATLHQHFYAPFTRELGLSLGGISCSKKSLSYVLNRPEGGKVVMLLPGGAFEAYNGKPGTYKIVLKKRKGFVKLALTCGSPIVPTITFGETDLFDQVEGPTLRKVQEFIRKLLGLAPVVFMGRGFFQYSFGLIPRRRQITTIVGRPIEVTKVDNPTNEQVEELHKKFTEEIDKLFEEHKHKYLENPEEKHLEIV